MKPTSQPEGAHPAGTELPPRQSAADRAPSDRSAGASPAVAEPALSEAEGAPRAPVWAVLVATLFGAGRLKPAPGTWASIATVLLWAAASSLLPSNSRTWATIAAAALVTVLGIPAATLVSRASGLKDPQFIVVDEVAGQLVALIAIPLAWKTFLASLILFRAFDILKPFPVRQLERLPEGLGIVVDDLGAGLYALAIMHLLLHFELLIK